jgi:hypothetical protein
VARHAELELVPVLPLVENAEGLVLPIRVVESDDEIVEGGA